MGPGIGRPPGAAGIVGPMTMQPYGTNPIEARKREVRKNARSAAVCVGGGVAGGVVLTAVFGTWFWLVLGLVVAVGGGAYYWSKVRKGIDPGNGVGGNGR